MAQDKYTISRKDLFTIFLAGFEFGVNEGVFPKVGTYEAFDNLMAGKSLTPEDGTTYSIKLEKFDEPETVITEDYFDGAWSKLKKILLGQKFGRFVFDEEEIGSVYLKHSDLAIYCSPFWEYECSDEIPPADKMGLNVNVLDADCITIGEFLIQYPYPTDALEFEKFQIWYVERLEELSKQY